MGYDRYKRLLVVFALISAFSSSYADSFGDRSKWGLSVDRLQNGNSGEYGILLGFKQAGYFSNSNVYAGYEIHAGTDRGQSPGQDNLTYGGINLGFDGSYYKAISYDFGMLVGYGFGNIARYAVSSQGAALQPSVSMGLVLINGFRASFSASYLYMPGTPFSTPVYGIRLEHKLSADY